MSKLAALAAAGSILIAGGSGCAIEQDPTNPENMPATADELVQDEGAVNYSANLGTHSFEERLKEGTVEIDILKGACAIIGYPEGTDIKAHFVPNPGNLAIDYKDGVAELTMNAAYDPGSQSFIYGQLSISDLQSSSGKIWTAEGFAKELVHIDSDLEVVTTEVESLDEAVVASTPGSQEQDMRQPVMTVTETRKIKAKNFDEFATSSQAKNICEQGQAAQPIRLTKPA